MTGQLYLCRRPPYDLLLRPGLELSETGLALAVDYWTPELSLRAGTPVWGTWQSTAGVGVWFQLEGVEGAPELRGHSTPYRQTEHYDGRELGELDYFWQLTVHDPRGQSGRLAIRGAHRHLLQGTQPNLEYYLHPTTQVIVNLGAPERRPPPPAPTLPATLSARVRPHHYGLPPT